MEMTAETKKKGRKRTKRLCQQIKEQMEFYFSDANLHKDRYLKQCIDQAEAGFVDLEIFTKFRKIEALTTDCAIIAKALTKSSVLQLNNERNKVRRISRLTERKDVDSRTVYVECLPPKADHEWMRKIFSACGVVEYVSLPRFKSTGDIKGFGFVEFSKAEEAEIACQILNNPPASVADQMPGKFPKGGKDFQRLQRQLQAYNDQGKNEKLPSQDPEIKPDVPSSHSTTDVSPNKKGRKRKLESAESNGADTPGENETAADDGEQVKRGKLADDDQRKSVKRTFSDTAECDDNDRDNDDVHSAKKRLVEEDTASAGVDPDSESLLKTDDINSQRMNEKVNSGTKDSENTQDKEKESSSETKQSCMRKRKAESQETQEEKAKKVRICDSPMVKVTEKVKKKKRKKRNKERNKEKICEVPELRVIPKVDWLCLKREYISLQRASMKQMKQQLREAKGLTSPSRVMEGDKKRPGRVLIFTPDVIVKVCSQDALYRKKVKLDLSSYGLILYADLTDGDTHGYLRCATSEAASNIAQAVVSEMGLESYVLAGEEEQLYWDKILADQEATLARKSKTKKRGRDKLIERAENQTLEKISQKHVVFDD